MKIGITSQNFRFITGHAGKSRRFIIFEPDENGHVRETDRWDLPKDQSLHEFHGDFHPLFNLDVLITGGCGQGFMQRLASYGVQVIATSETDPEKAASAVHAGKNLPAAAPHDHDHSHAPISIQ